MQGDGDGVSALDHVVVGHDDPAGIDDEARTQRLRAPVVLIGQRHGAAEALHEIAELLEFLGIQRVSGRNGRGGNVDDGGEQLFDNIGEAVRGWSGRGKRRQRNRGDDQQASTHTRAQAVKAQHALVFHSNDS